ncbi:MAG: recombinase A [Planctomycetota bacterium]
MSSLAASTSALLRNWKSLQPTAPSEWSLSGLAGRLVELSGSENSSALTAAFGLVRQAQLLGEPVAWITPHTESFFPPDVANGGVDLTALAVVRIFSAQRLTPLEPRSRTRDSRTGGPRAYERAMARAADQLVRSGGFGLLVLDLGSLQIAMGMLSRLLGLAQKHNTALLFLTDKPDRAPSLGSLVSLRAQAVRRRTGPDEFTCELQVLKDKRRAPGWSHKEVCGGPAGLH